MYNIETVGNIKKFTSSEVNYTFNFKTGYTELWGKSYEDDPDFMTYGPTIADIEITTKCGGPGGIPCKMCYKSNTPQGENMSFDTFKNIFDKLPDTLTQIAFGACADLSSNPDIWKIMDYCRNNGRNLVVPNITVADVSDEVADKLSAVCGAVAVSRYDNKNYCYDSVKKLTDRGMGQVNIHICVHEDSYEQVVETLYDIQHDPRLENLNAIVFLSLKQKGRGKSLTPLSEEQFNKIVYYSFINNIRFGFDSCSAQKFLKSIKNFPNYDMLEKMVDPCESSRFSAYINVKGDYFPCSFSEGTGDWKEGLSVLECNDFVEDIWNHEKNVKFRDRCTKNLIDKISCSLYNI